jgi:hypothetical protein
LHSSLIGKIEKAKRYADEKDHYIEFDSFVVRFHGENSEHQVELSGSSLTCDCEFFHDYKVCSHTMALERVLDGMLPRIAREQIEERTAQAVG